MIIRKINVAPPCNQRSDAAPGTGKIVPAKGYTAQLRHIENGTITQVGICKGTMTDVHGWRLDVAHDCAGPFDTNLHEGLAAVIDSKNENAGIAQLCGVTSAVRAGVDSSNNRFVRCVAGFLFFESCSPDQKWVLLRRESVREG